MRQGRIGMLLFTLGVVLVSTGASWPLNPLVTRRADPGVAPAECSEGLAPAPTPRIIASEIPAPEIVPASIPAPPSRTLRDALEDAHAALVRNDRPAFDAALVTAGAILRDYPPGAERTAAEEALRVYDDAAFVWNAQFQSPFFDQSSEAYARTSRYSGYAEAVRRGVLTDDRDRRFFPAAESRDFLTRAAAERLSRLGIRTPAPRTRVARAERPRTPAPVIADASPAPTQRRSASRRPAPTSRPRSRKSATPSAITAPASPDPPAPAARAVTESAPATPPAPAPTPAAAPASPAAEGQPVDDVPEPVDTAAADTATPPISTETAAPAPDPATTTTTAAPAERRSVIVPALLIAIGLGVLFVLFRVSR
jgi:hypothetical protein